MSADRLAGLMQEIGAALSDAIVAHVTPELRAAVALTELPAPESEPLLLTWRQISKRLGNISESSIRAMWASGELPSVKVNGLRFTRSADLREYVAGLCPSLPGGEMPQLSVVPDAA